MVWKILIGAKPGLQFKGLVVAITVWIMLVLTTVALAGTTQYQYDTNGRLIEVVTSDGLYYTYEYDSTGNIVAELIAMDSDGDGLIDPIEADWGGCLNPDDADSDDDGIPDGTEDANHNGVQDEGETHPCKIDTDGDGIQDGTELGYTLADIGADTDTTIFQPDLDPSTTTLPTIPDTDDDGFKDGEEDKNANGRIDPGESDPNDPASKPGGNGVFFPVKSKSGEVTIIYLE